MAAEVSLDRETRRLSSNEIDVQRERISALKRERENLLDELRARSANANELRKRMKEKEATKAREVKQRMNGTYLGTKLHNTYGVRAVDKAVDFYDPPTGHTTEHKEKSSLVADVMEQKRLEHRVKTEQFQDAINILNDHRRNLVSEQVSLRFVLKLHSLANINLDSNLMTLNITKKSFYPANFLRKNGSCNLSITVNQTFKLGSRKFNFSNVKKLKIFPKKRPSKFQQPLLIPPNFFF